MRTLTSVKATSRGQERAFGFGQKRLRHRAVSAVTPDRAWGRACRICSDRAELQRRIKIEATWEIQKDPLLWTIRRGRGSEDYCIKLIDSRGPPKPGSLK